MSNPRANLSHILVAAGGVLLFLLTFLKWFGPGEGAKPWEIFSLADIVIAFGALIAAGLAVAHLAGAAANLPPQVTIAQRVAGIAASGTAIIFIVELVAGELNFKFGGFLALIAALALLAGTVLAVRPDLAAKVEEATANIGAGQFGGGPGAGTPGAGPTAGGAPGAGPAPGAAPGLGAQQPAPTPAPTAAPTPAPASPPTEGPGASGGPPSPPSPTSPTPGDAGPAPTPTPEPAPATPAQPAQAESSGPAAGWYPDPQGQARLRWWDGSRWTDNTGD